MESPISTPHSTDPQTAKEDTGLSSSSSSSSRLNNLSFSSRRVRHVSPKSATPERTSELDTSPPLWARSVIETKFSRILYFPSLPVLNGDSHRAPLRTHTHRVARVVFFVWIWFCLAYFTAVLCAALKRTALEWRDAPALPGSGEPMSSPESMLATLPLEHRLSKLSSLYPVPLSFKPFILGPRRYDNNPTVACLWAEESDLPRLPTWASSWLGPISLLVTSPAEPDSPSHKKLLETLTILSKSTPNVSFHVLHTHVPLRNFNAYINLARLFSPSPRVLLFPPHAMSSWSPLPLSSHRISSIALPLDKNFIIPMHSEGTMLNSTHTDLYHTTYLLSSATLLNRDSAPWCTERLFTMSASRGGTVEPSALDTEMAAHWKECVWNVWLRTAGAMGVISGEGWASTATMSLPPPPDTVETSMRVRIARKQRSETCVLVARELIARGQWIESGSEDNPRTVSGILDLHEQKIKSYRAESSKAQWLRSVCKETLDKWGREIID